MTIAIIAFLADIQTWFLQQRGLWALIPRGNSTGSYYRGFSHRIPGPGCRDVLSCGMSRMVSPRESSQCSSSSNFLGSTPFSSVHNSPSVPSFSMSPSSPLMGKSSKFLSLAERPWFRTGSYIIQSISWPVQARYCFDRHVRHSHLVLFSISNNHAWQTTAGSWSGSLSADQILRNSTQHG